MYEIIIDPDNLTYLIGLVGAILSSLGISAASNQLIVSGAKLAIRTANRLGEGRSGSERKKIAIESLKKLLPLILRAFPGTTARIEVIIESVYDEWKEATAIAKDPS